MAGCGRSRPRPQAARWDHRGDSRVAHRPPGRQQSSDRGDQPAQGATDHRIPASSGKTRRHRLHRGGDRDANKALRLAVVVRMRFCPRTRAYVERRTKEGLSKPEIMRCIKRYLAREIYHALVADFEALHAT
jgi:hypothetical protein